MALVSSLPVLSLCSSGNLQTAAVPTTISLLPLFDLLNHDPSVSQPELCIEPTDPCRLRMITRAAYASGEQVCYVDFYESRNLSRVKLNKLYYIEAVF
ncbi:unnamed protein product [Protopolystoma xenopodis]|uniref:SET domain-containing protein n=1 Tax=Protopolystoma xenopodis TaxID=117903 RepID=A0A3S5CJ89_9PLAT|nr:unnamed protein product [Protopolystoma xenopodis]